MKKAILCWFIFHILIAVAVVGQPYGNEWIVPSQQYYKFSTAEEGIYRVSYNELLSAGIPLSTIDPRKIKLFHRGQEHAIYIEGQNDARFDPADYLEFFGKRNDGTLDKELYVSSAAHSNNYYSLFSDTTAYFLTWGPVENGTRMQNFKENNVSNLPPESYHINSLLQLQTAEYSGGLTYPLGLASGETWLSAYDHGEAWTGTRITHGQFRDILFSGLTETVPSGPVPILEVLLSGRNNQKHNVSIEVGPNASSLRLLKTIEFNLFYDTLSINNLQWTDIAGGTFVCRIRVNNLGVNNQISVTYTQLKYAETMNHGSFQQKKYSITPSATTRSYIEIQNVPTGSKLYNISDERNTIDIGYNALGTGINAMLPNGTAGVSLLLTSRRLQVPKISRAALRNINPATAEFVIITNKNLRKSTSKYPDVPKAYAAYRASAKGGGFDTLLINVDELYNMFSYGETTPLAIRRFARYLAEKGNPSYIFILGKGLLPFYNFNRRDYNSIAVKDHIPTFGWPGTDIIFTAGLKGSTYEPGIPIGRVAGNTPEVLEAYFDKVKEMEALPYDALWRKELIHLSGGKTPVELSIFKNFVEGFRAVAEGIYLGGKVETISKRSSDATEIINIADQVNAGKVLVTFFGHSASESTDIDIGKVTDDALGYHNKGKYPMMIVNGCVAGDMYQDNPNSFGDDWISAANRGAVGFLAHTGVGITSNLKRYTDLFYEVAFSDSLFFSKGVGMIQKEAGRRYQERFSVNPIDIAQIQQFALQGDPSLPVFGLNKADLQVASENVFVKSLDGNPINAFTEEFLLGIAVQNFGKVSRDSSWISLKRKLSNGRELPAQLQRIAPVHYRDTVYFTVNSVGPEGFGINNFFITIDPANAIEEEVETNNNTVFEYFIPLGGTKNLAPYNFAIVNKSQITLIAQSLDPLVQDKSYLFELDTTNLFNSPVKKQSNISGTSSAKWPVSIFSNVPEKDTLVFYWRTKFANPTEQELDVWYLSSFTYIINGSPGWAMAHMQQFEETASKHILLDSALRQWNFEELETRLFVSTFGGTDTLSNYTDEQFIINNTQYLFPTIYWQQFCLDNSVNMVAFDKSTTIPYLGLGQSNVLDPNSCGRQPQVINMMSKAAIESELKIEKYIDAVDEGDFVLLFSIGAVSWQTFPPSTISKLGELGIQPSDIQSMANGDPLIILSKKGLGSALIIKADNSGGIPAKQKAISLEQNITGKATTGTINSRRIGPARQWKTLTQKTRALEDPTTDDYYFTVFGIDQDSKRTMLIDNITQAAADLSGISGDAYPYLEVEQTATDAETLTPPQLRQWVVLYDGLPEGLLSYKAGQALSMIEKKEGEIHDAAFIYENVSELTFADSIAVEYTLLNQADRKTYTDTLMLKPLPAGESAPFSLNLDTRHKPGLNNLQVFANPYLQLEQDFNNNLINFPDYLKIEADNTNPIMEVTVDGQFIMDGDIVSPTPLIVMRLKDENTVLFKTDTIGVNLYLNKQCEGCQPVRINFSSPNIVWSPATPQSAFKVEYQPTRLDDGIYTLKSEASDASGNESGTTPYSVSFEVINESQITNFFPYPNPFSTRTQFVFTLTGSEIPDDIIIQIMTVSGTVVREITMDEIGPIKIGNNRTEYAWDGRDEYGDQLANGVYLYRVKLLTNGIEMKHRQTSADKAFVNGFGKIYLLR